MTFTTHPELNGDFQTLLKWLKANNLTAINSQVEQYTNQHNIHRVAINRLSQGQLDDIPKRQVDANCTQKDNLLDAQMDPKPLALRLRWSAIPADALACYQPFHCNGEKEWGIYLFADKLLSHNQTLYKQSKDFQVWDFDTLLHLLVFEVFNHEFFHHIVESTATYLEILQGAAQHPFPVFLNYKYREQQGIEHPHHPLEEALANAYAYNALSFISRLKAGYKTATVRLYQAVIRQHWQYAPKGYKDSENYIYGKHIQGGACLLEQILNNPKAASTSPLSTIAHKLMPSGYTALFTKPTIPTYLLGTHESIARMQQIVPALNATYTQLFWPKETQLIDHFIQKKKGMKTSKDILKST
jgi:hypothetical protein